jgi:hypothetical protein
MIPVPFQIGGPTGGSKSTQYSSELTQNIYMDYSDAADRRGAHDFPGLAAFGTQSGVDRGWHVMAEVLYKICGTSLYRVSAAGAYTSLGSVSGTGRAVFADDGSNLYFTAGGSLYIYDGSTVATVTQSVVSNPRSIAYINRQFIITGDNGLFGTSDVADGETYNALNYAEAETQPDPIIRAYVFTQYLYLLGGKSIESWYNSGEGNPPFNRQDTALVNVGCSSTWGVCSTDQYLYWLGDDRKFYRATGGSFQPISTLSISNALEAMSTVNDCILSGFVMDGQDFVLAVFPTENKSYLYSETYNYWVVLAAGTNIPGDRWYGNAVINCYGKNLVADHRNGNVYELDKDTYTDNGDARLRIRVLPSFTSALIGQPGKRITVGQIRLNIQRGMGLATGQGSEPVLMCQMSNDGGHTYAGETWVDMGVMGDYLAPVDYFDFSTGYEIRARIMCSDPVPLSLFDGVVYLTEAGY